MSDERKQSLFIVQYAGKDTADQVYDVLHHLEKQKLQEIEIKTAATVYRQDNGKLKLKHKDRVTVWKGLAGGAAIGLVLGGPAGAAAGAVAGSLVGSTRSGERKDAKEFLEDKLGDDDSALVILVSDADWERVYEATASFKGTDLQIELTPEAQEQISELVSDGKVAAAVQEDIDIEEEEPEADDA